MIVLNQFLFLYLVYVLIFHLLRHPSFYLGLQLYHEPQLLQMSLLGQELLLHHQYSESLLVHFNGVKVLNIDL